MNGAYQEPPEVTAMKKLIEDARATGLMASEVSEDNTPAAGSPNDEETAAVKVSLINQLMDYQYKTAEALAYEYSRFSLDDGEVEEYVEEDMEKMFGSSIYYMELTEEEKLMYYDSFMERGLFSNRRVKRFSSSPAEYLLPELTPRIMVTLDGTEEELHTIQESIAPVASVAYRLLGRGGEGYLVLRGNADESSILLDSFDEQTYIQGDFLLNLNGIVTMGEWFKDGMEIGLLVDGNRAGRISNVYELVY